MDTPQFKGTHLFDRLCWAKENLDAVQSDYRVIYEDKLEECAKILVADPNWMACALQGGILPPVWVYWELKKDEAQPDFKKHTRGYLLHNTEPMEAMTEEQAIEYLIQKDVPEHVGRIGMKVIVLRWLSVGRINFLQLENGVTLGVLAKMLP